jgi:hypothetical protein
MNKAPRLEVGICVIALETSIQTQACFSLTAPIHWFSLYSVFFEHKIHLLCGKNSFKDTVWLKDGHVQSEGQQTCASVLGLVSKGA